jgi:Domain of unknown function (DUF397)
MITMAADLSHAVWRKSSRSANGGNCVEVACNLPGMVALRDSKNREGATLAVSDRAWSGLVQWIKDGALDL